MLTGYEELRNGAAVIDLSDRGKIEVQGEDRARLLHALSTNDVAGLAAGAGLRAFFLNANGRILFDVAIYNLGPFLWLDTEHQAGPGLLAHLDKYIIADDVTLEDRTQSWAAFGLEGPQSVSFARERAIPVPEARHSVLAFEGGFVARVALAGMDGLRLFFPDVERETVRKRVSGLTWASPDSVEVVRLENRLSRYGLEISDRYLVQETQQLQAVHFNKGCYLGQEIVERVRSRGQVHRLLTPIRIAGNVAPQAGAKLSVGEKEVGEIASAQFSPAENEVVGFAYLRGEGLLPGGKLTVLVGSVAQQASIRA